jgi:hypothetical protein
MKISKTYIARENMLKRSTTTSCMVAMSDELFAYQPSKTFKARRLILLYFHLVRNNDKGSIGVMKEPERVNVMLSRARCGLIMLGSKRCWRIASPSKAASVGPSSFS